MVDFTKHIRRPQGVNYDQAPYELPNETWTDVNNTSTVKGNTKKSKGYQEVLATPDPPATDPLFTAPFVDSGTQYWYWGSSTTLNRWDSSTATHTALTIPSTGGTFNTLVGAENWDYTILQGVFVVTPGKGNAAPMSWLQGASEPAGFDTLKDWETAAGAGNDDLKDFSCNIIRSYKNRLIAMDMEDASSNDLPYTIVWSEAANPGLEPANWEYTDTASTSGRVELSETTGQILDARPLRDSMIIYKSDSIYTMDFIGGSFIFSFRQLYRDDGLLSKNCIADMGNAHVIVGRQDIYLFDGHTKKSISSGIIKDYFYSQLTQDDDSGDAEQVRDKVFAFFNPLEDEVLICWPSSSATYCNKAIVWSTQTQQWSRRDLPETYFMNVGIVNEEITTVSWDAVHPATWDNIDMLWTSEPANYADAVLICGSVDTKFYRGNDGETADGTPFISFAERKGLQLTENPNDVVEVNRLIPKFSGSGDVAISVGSEYVKGGSVNFSAPVTFTIGTDEFIPVRVQGRYIAVRFESESDNTWVLDGYTFTGNYGGDR